MGGGGTAVRRCGEWGSDLLGGWGCNLTSLVNSQPKTGQGVEGTNFYRRSVFLRVTLEFEESGAHAHGGEVDHSCRAVVHSHR